MPEEAPSRLLVVDDHELARRTLESRLEAEDFIVETVESGRQALARLDKGGVDLVLLDIIMPEMDGLSVLREIRKSRSMSDLPVIMVTALAESPDIVRGLTLGANDYVTKPIDFPVVAARVRTHLALERASRQLKEANRTISESADRLQLIMDSATIAIFATDGDGVLTRVNETGSEITGYEVADLVGMPFASLFADDCRSEIAVLLALVAGEGYFVTNREARLRRKDDEERVLSVSLRALGRGHRAMGVVGTAEDVTDARRQRDDLAELVAAMADPDPRLAALLEPPPGALVRAQAAARSDHAGADEEAGEVEPAADERRAHRRRRAYKGGKLSFNNDTSLMDCIVRDLSEGGAKLEFEAFFDCPRFVRLRITDGAAYDCEARRFANKIMGVRFLKRL